MIICKFFFEGNLKIDRVIAIFPGEKNFSKFEEKKSNCLFELRMAIPPSIFKILRSSSLQTPPFHSRIGFCNKKQGF